MHGLKELRVIDHSSEIAGPYCSKLFADAGADVIKLEASQGDPLRTWSATGADLGNTTPRSCANSVTTKTRSTHSRLRR